MNTEEQLKAFEAAVADEKFRYARARSWRASGYVADDGDYIVHVYHADPKSPTGVHCAGSIGDLRVAAPILARHGRAFPLSPTEGLNKSGAV